MATTVEFSSNGGWSYSGSTKSTMLTWVNDLGYDVVVKYATIKCGTGSGTFYSASSGNTFSGNGSAIYPSAILMGDVPCTGSNITNCVSAASGGTSIDYSQLVWYDFYPSTDVIVPSGDSLTLYKVNGEGPGTVFTFNRYPSSHSTGSTYGYPTLTVEEYVTSRTLTLNTTTGIESFTGAGSYDDGSIATTICTASYGYSVYKYEGTNSTGTATETWYTSDSPQTHTDTWTMGADRIITAYATPWIHTVAYDANGGSDAPSSQTKTYGSTLTLTSTKPDRTGYTFLGWSHSASSTDAEYSAGAEYARDQNGGTYTLYAIWSKNEHKVNLSKVTGIASVSGAGSYKYGDSVTINASPSSGYTFSNWSGTYSSTSLPYTFSMPDNDVSLTANASVVNYSISYDLDGGSLASPNPASYNITTNSFTLNNPTKEGYAFTGWTGSNGTTPSTNLTIAKGSTGDRSYKANWTKNGYPYRVNHYLMNVSGSGYTLDKTDKGSAEYGSTLIGVIHDYGEGFTSPQTTQSVVISTSEVNNVINYYYTRNKFPVSLICGDGIENVSGAGSYYYGARVELDAVVATSHTWTKWTGTYESTTKAYVIAAMPAQTVSMTACATIITYPINYYPNGGTGGPTDQTKIYGQALTLSSSWPDAKKYTVTFNPTGGTISSTSKQVECSFSAWNTQADGSGKSYASSSVYSDNAALNLYAQWNNNAIGTLPTPARNDCEFVGWFTAASGGIKIDPSFIVSNNVTLYARWKYKVSYESNGGSDSPADEWKLHDEVLIITDAHPSKEGNIFAGWNTKADGSGISYSAQSPYVDNIPVTLYAQWRTAIYTVTFEPRGGTWSDGSTASKSFEVHHGQSVTDLPDITNGTKKLVGWTDSYENVISDRTLYALWNKTPIWIMVDAGGGYKKWVKFM